MILLERVDVNRIGLDPYWFLVKWVPGSPAAMAADYVEMPSPGPFLLKVHDEAAWVSHGGERDEWKQVAMRLRYDCSAQQRYGLLVNLYSEAAGLTRMSFLGRWASIRKRLRETPDTWEDWQKVYRWGDGSDLTWSGLIHHPCLETREHRGRKEVRYVSQ